MSLLFFCIRKATEIHTPSLFLVCRDHFPNLCSQNPRTINQAPERLKPEQSLMPLWHHCFGGKGLALSPGNWVLVPVFRCLKDQRPRSGLGGNLVQSSCYLLSSLWRFSWYTELALPKETRWVWPAPLTCGIHNIPEVTLCPFSLIIIIADVIVATRTLARRSTLSEF